MILLSGICAKTVEASAFLHVPTCDQTTAAFFVLLLLGVVFLVIGIVVLRKGTRGEAESQIEETPRDAAGTQSTLDTQTSRTAQRSDVRKLTRKPSHRTRNIAIGVVLIVVVLVVIAASLGGTAPQNSQQPQTYDVVIRYTESYMTKIGFSQAGTNQVFLILSLQIENDGANSFAVNAFYFHVTINDVEYNVDSATFALSGYLQPVQLQTGGTMSGSLAFQVPAGTSTYAPSYQGFGTPPTINWIHQ